MNFQLLTFFEIQPEPACIAGRNNVEGATTTCEMANHKAVGYYGLPAGPQKVLAEDDGDPVLQTI